MKQQDASIRSTRLLLVCCLLGWLACFLLSGDRVQGLLVNSVLLASGTLLVCLPIGTLLAVAIAKSDVLGRSWLERVLIVLLFVPLYVQATAWQAALGQGGYLFNEGWLTGWAGAIWIHGMAAVPWVVLFVVATLRKVSRELEEESLQDASDWQVLSSVSLRQAAVGIVASALWVSVICFGEITVTDLFQVRTFAEEIYTAASLGVLDSVQVEQTSTSNNTAIVPQFSTADLWMGVLAVAILVLAALVAIVRWVPINDFVSSRSDWTWQMGRGRHVWSLLVWALALLVIGLPIFGLAGKAGRQVSQSSGQVVHSWSPEKATSLVLSSPWQHRREFGWSLVIGSVVTLTTVSIAVLIAWAIRTRWLPTWPTAAVLSVLFALPGPLLGVWIIRCLNQPADSWLFPLTWCYDHTILAPVLAQFLRALPPTTLVLAAQFGSLPQDVIDSSVSEGANWWQQLVSVAIPWCWPAIIVSVGIAMIVSLGELAATVLVVPPGVSPLSVRIFGLIHYGAEDRVSALCLMLIIVLAIVIAAGWQFTRVVISHRNRGQ